MEFIKSIQFREKVSNLYLQIVTVLGWGSILFSLRDAHFPNPIILILFIVFLFISELHPIPVWKGYTTIHFPLLFVMLLIFHTSETLIVYALVVLLVNFIKKRPLRIIFFNPAQMGLSLFLADLLVNRLMPAFMLFNNKILNGLFEYFLCLSLYYVINNLIVDIILVIRSQPYPFTMWVKKMRSELLGYMISLLYGTALFYLGSTDRGIIDFYSYFFFFSPLVGLSLLGSVIAKLKKEQNRLKALFFISTELNKALPSEDWWKILKDRFQEIEVDGAILWIKQNEKWVIEYQNGLINGNIKESSETLYKFFNSLSTPILFGNVKKEGGNAKVFFHTSIKSLVYIPLRVEEETLGMFVVGRVRTKSFTEDDISLIATLSNQLAVILNSRLLIKEKEKRLIVEERNRIARDIHDGIAQTIAGAILKLETAQRKIVHSTMDAQVLIERSIQRLRTSLKELRESIYKLRPIPTENSGLVSALLKKIDDTKRDVTTKITLEIRGKETQLNPIMEEFLFNAFQESLRNSIKHANAEKIECLLSYQSEKVLLKVKDDGIGFSLFHAMIKAKSHQHFGILNMNEAAEKMNAFLQINSKEMCGTEVTIVVPKIGAEEEFDFDQAHVSG